MKLKHVSTALFVVILSTLVMGCSNSTIKESGTASDSKEQKNESQVDLATASYPLQTDKKLSLWTASYNGNLTLVPNLKDIPFMQEWQTKTGVPVDFINPPTGQEKEQFNVMLASGDLPDLIQYYWRDYPGGPEKAINDGVIIALNDVIDKFAPNLKKYLNEHPEIDKMIKTDSGKYYAFPFIRGDDSLSVFQGPMLRQDYLQKYGLEVPTTMDEWYKVLKTFKEKSGLEAPLTFRGLNDLAKGAFVGAYGVNRSFYVEDGKVLFGPEQPAYKDFLATMSKWYSEGLIDKNIATVDTKAQDANMTSGASGATVSQAGSGIGKWMGSAQGSFDLVAAPYPVLNKGDKPKFGQKDFAGIPMYAITGSSKNAELAAKFLDYGYSEEGHLFFNFGTEGVSYKMENGYPKYTDLIMKNPDKLPVAQAMSLYILGNMEGPFIQDTRYLEQYYVLQQQKDAIRVWNNTDAMKHMLPPVTSSPEESTELAKIMNEVNALVDETTLKIMLGASPVDEFDSYLKKLKSLNIDRAIEIEQAALDRYNKR